jgi:death-on-curing protein
VLSLHEFSLASFGGKRGVRDANLLDSALARAKNLWVYGSEPTLHRLAAAIGYGICKNHPFIDGNKRTAFISTAVFLEMNGFRVNAPEVQVVQTMNALAAGTMSEEEFAAWLEQTFPPKRKR